MKYPANVAQLSKGGTRTRQVSRLPVHSMVLVRLGKFPMSSKSLQSQYYMNYSFGNYKVLLMHRIERWKSAWSLVKGRMVNTTAMFTQQVQRERFYVCRNECLWSKHMIAMHFMLVA